MKALSVLEQKLLEANKKLYREAKTPLRSHGPDHHERVWRRAVALAEKMGVKFDAEVLAGACLVHDMAGYYPELQGEDSHERDRVVAEEVLSEVGFPEAKMVAAVDAVAHHGSDPKFRREGEAIEIVLLRDADKLDAFGPVGVARIVMVRALQGDTMAMIVDDFWTGGHLKRKWEAITTAEARAMGRADYEYSRDFFERLANGIKDRG